jgi:hypothetical protein
MPPQITGLKILRAKQSLRRGNKSGFAAAWRAFPLPERSLRGHCDNTTTGKWPMMSATA